jgi:hypothetical protein
MPCSCCGPVSGPDPGDLASVPSRLDFDAGVPVEGLRAGYFPAWMQESPATDVDRAALETVRKLGMVPVEVAIPDWPYDALNLIPFAGSGSVSFPGSRPLGNCSTTALQVTASR